MKSKGDEERIQFLDSVANYCKYIGFDKEKTLMMLGIVRNFFPEPGQEFIDCDFPDEIDDLFTKKVIDDFDRKN